MSHTNSLPIPVQSSLAFGTTGIYASTHKDGHLLEVPQIEVISPFVSWTGTIQDLQAIPAIATNALNLISRYGLGEEETTELLCLLRHFGVTPTVPGPQVTQHRSKEVAMIAAAIWNNRHEGLSTLYLVAPNGMGIIDQYDLVATWANEFYDLHKDRNWEESSEDWEEMVCAFATDKLRNFQK